MKIKTVVLALSMLVLAVGSAEAHKLPIGTAKQKIQQQASRECKGSCTEVTVNRCRRNSSHRVSCNASVTFRNGNGCTWVGIATANHKSSKVQLLVKGLKCGKA